jgi:hypothetical protein
MADMLATPADLASLLQVPQVDTASATLALELATSLIQAAAGQRIVQVVNDVAVLDVDADDCGAWLALPEGPVTAVSSVMVGALPVSDFTVQLRRGRIYRPYGWRSATVAYWNAPSTVTVTYTHGYASGDQRLELARSVALSLASSAYGNPSGAVREQIDDYAVQYDAAATGLQIAPALADALRRRYGRPTGSVLMVKK